MAALFFPTREMARQFKAKREAKGLATKVVDQGKAAPKRFGCELVGLRSNALKSA